MQDQYFRALVVKQGPNGSFSREVSMRKLSDLPDHEVLVKVSHTALNYKDALSANGHAGVSKNYPHTPGIDASGYVVESQHAAFQPGDPVVVTGYDLGMNTPGGFAEYIRVPAAWLVPLPAGLTLREAALIGTAGFTAALSLNAMSRNGQRPEMGPILVTGATGGVGSMAIAILKKAGYTAWASTGKTEAHAWLQTIGAANILSREEVVPAKDRPLYPSAWAGAIDTVGGATLSAVIRSCMPKGNVAVCGLVDAPEFDLNVYPFILRGVNLLGIESAECPMSVRWQVWQRLGGAWKPENLDLMAVSCKWDEVTGWMDKILAGKVTGRVVLDL